MVSPRPYIIMPAEAYCQADRGINAVGFRKSTKYCDSFRFLKLFCVHFCWEGTLCRLLEISRSGYYTWKNRGVSARKQHEQKLFRILISLHERYPAAGLNALVAMIRKESPCSRNTVHRLMKLYNIHSIRKRAFRITTNSNHNYAVSPNILNRDFTADKPNQKWVGFMPQS